MSNFRQAFQGYEENRDIVLGAEQTLQQRQDEMTISKEQMDIQRDEAGAQLAMGMVPLMEGMRGFYALKGKSALIGKLKDIAGKNDSFKKLKARLGFGDDEEPTEQTVPALTDEESQIRRGIIRRYPKINDDLATQRAREVNDKDLWKTAYRGKRDPEGVVPDDVIERKRVKLRGKFMDSGADEEEEIPSQVDLPAHVSAPVARPTEVTVERPPTLPAPAERESYEDISGPVERPPPARVFRALDPAVQRGVEARALTPLATPTEQRVLAKAYREKWGTSVETRLRSQGLLADDDDEEGEIHMNLDADADSPYRFSGMRGGSTLEAFAKGMVEKPTARDISQDMAFRRFGIKAQVKAPTTARLPADVTPADVDVAEPTAVAPTVAPTLASKFGFEEGTRFRVSMGQQARRTIPKPLSPSLEIQPVRREIPTTGEMELPQRPKILSDVPTFGDKDISGRLGSRMKPMGDEMGRTQGEVEASLGNEADEESGGFWSSVGDLLPSSVGDYLGVGLGVLGFGASLASGIIEIKDAFKESGLIGKEQKDVNRETQEMYNRPTFSFGEQAMSNMDTGLGEASFNHF